VCVHACLCLGTLRATARRLAASEREALEAAEECPALLDICAKGGSLGLHVQDEGCFCLPALLTADAASVRKTFTQLKALATSSKADTRWASQLCTSTEHLSH
jgi:hypothetical protein